MILRIIIPAALLYVAAAASPIWAQRGSEQTLDLQADRIEVDDKAQRAIASGSVRARQGDMTITSQTATAKYTGSSLGPGTGPEMRRIDARGKVVVTRPSETAESDFAIYDLDKRTVLMLGNVSLKRGGNVVNGGRLTLDLDTNQAVMNGSTVKGSSAGGSGVVTGKAPSGRVTGIFSVPKKAAPSAAASSK